MKYHDDIYYIERVLKGDSLAYAGLVAKHKNMVFSVALRILNNREDAEELAQDCFVKAYQSLGAFERKSKFSTWLYRIAYNAAISKTRKKSLEVVDADEHIMSNYSEDVVRESVDQLSESEQNFLIDKALSRLNAADNLLISLFYKSDQTVQEISEITGLSDSNVKVRLYRIRKKLYREISVMMKYELVP